ncbi:MAG: sugar transferase [Myxococcota bacterium]
MTEQSCGAVVSEDGAQLPNTGGDNRTVLFLSCLGGSVTERLAEALRKNQWSTEVRSLWSPGQWRARMNGGRVSRVRTRATALGLFPLEALWAVTQQLPDVVVATTNPFLLPLVLVATRSIHRRPVVVLAYDLYPDALVAAGVVGNESIVARSMAAATSYWMRRADSAVFIGERMATHAAHRYGAACRRIRVIPLGASLEEFSLDPPEPASDFEQWCASRTLFSYVGNLGEMHDWKTLAEAGARFVAASDRTNPAGIVIAASGPGVVRLRQAWAHLSEDQVRFIDPLEDREWARLLAFTDVSLVTLRHGAKSVSVPSKTYSAMAAGTAVMAVAPEDSDLADLVTKTLCGVVVAPGDTTALVRTFVEMAENAEVRRGYQTKAREAAQRSYAWSGLVSHWQRLLHEVVDEDSAKKPSSTYGQRILDVIGAGSALLLTSPLLLGGALAVRWQLGRPIFFSHARAGKDGEPFTMWKLRTMRPPEPEEEGPEHDAKRLTRLGQVLRSTSIDELPALWNVLKGDMSLVGPRPLLLTYTERYSARQRRRLDVLPGITGWAQINGRNAISWQKKFALDAWYVDRKSAQLDLRILWRTVARVLHRDDIHAAGHVTMPEFMGDNDGA